MDTGAELAEFTSVMRKATEIAITIRQARFPWDWQSGIKYQPAVAGKLV